MSVAINAFPPMLYTRLLQSALVLLATAKPILIASHSDTMFLVICCSARVKCHRGIARSFLSGRSGKSTFAAEVKIKCVKARR